MAENEEEFPSTKLERSKILAKTGLKVGSNYARYLAKRATAKESVEEQKRALNSRNAQDIYREFTRLRGTALKMAQSMSMDVGVLPDEFAEVMMQAQYSVPPMNRALVRKIIREALGAYPEQRFGTFEAEAIAAASIGQVHRATLKDGRGVAVKVQYPNVRDTIKSDLSLGKSLFKRLLKARDIDRYFQEVQDRLIEETDYRNEARNIAFFSQQYAHDQIVTPQPIDDLTTENVLTMTFVDGIHLDPFLAHNPAQEEIDHFGQLLWNFVHEQIASNYRTVHADIHPGNFLFREDRRLGVVDFGCVKSFPQDFRDNFLLLFDAQWKHDEGTMRRLYEEVEILDPVIQTQAEQDALFDFFKRFGQIIMAPYQSDGFDFGNPAFKKSLTSLFKEASNFNEATGSEHFIYINKMLAGLFFFLIKLKPRIDTRYSRLLLDCATEEILDRNGTIRRAS